MNFRPWWNSGCSDLIEFARPVGWPKRRAWSKCGVGGIGGICKVWIIVLPWLVIFVNKPLPLSHWPHFWAKRHAAFKPPYH